jgi:hypothetical protein
VNDSLASVPANAKTSDLKQFPLSCAVLTTRDHVTLALRLTLLLVLYFLQTHGSFTSDENRNAFDPSSNITDVVKHVRYLHDQEPYLSQLQSSQEELEFVLDALSHRPQTAHEILRLPSGDGTFQKRLYSLRVGYAHDVAQEKRRVELLTKAFENRNKALNIQESVSVKRLSILASVFLPMSLASDILSMQSRFVDLHLLLYDFVGVFCIISSFTVLIYFFVQIYYNLESRVKLLPLQSQLRLLKCLVPSIWIVVLTSFVVGMVFRTILGLEILGVGLAAISFVTGSYALLSNFRRWLSMKMMDWAEAGKYGFRTEYSS